jgi:hypothetical protein
MRNVLFIIFSVVSLISLFIITYKEPALFFSTNEQREIIIKIFGKDDYIYYFILIVNAICVIILFIMKTDILFKYMLVIKFGLIPYWVITFLYKSILGIMTLFGILAFPIMILNSYIFLLFTSLSSILFLIHLLRNKLIKLPAFLLHFILQITFCWDIVSTIILVIKYKKIIKKIE